MDKVRWGIMSTANIGVNLVIPGMQKSGLCDITAIASRSGEVAREAADKLDIPKSYDSYEALLADPDIDAIYIPLPNHMHVSWAEKSILAGKHTLCEKPLGMNADEARKLLSISEEHPEIKVMEAFMYRMNPRWGRVKKIIEEGKIGEVKTMHSYFSYYNTNPDDIRNIQEYGGGGLMDIGCYCISASRLILGDLPHRVTGKMLIDEDFGTDKKTTGILDYGDTAATFMCSTQLTDSQRVTIFGTEGLLEIESPFTTNPGTPTKMWLQSGETREEIGSDACDQYQVQGERFSEAIIEDLEVPTPLTDAVRNMQVMDAIKQSAKTDSWVMLS